MTLKSLSDYQDALYGCRFCPMCKPAGEVPNLTQLESHTTRARAMILWRVLNGMITWEPRAVEIIYQSTLDSIAEAWCISHYPASGYMAAARAEIYAAGLAPEPVQKAVQHSAAMPQPDAVNGDVILLASEIAELNDGARIDTALQALRSMDAVPVVISSGALAYALGARDVARQQAQRVVDLIRASGAQTVIADGPQTLWALRRLYPAFGLDLAVTITSLSERLAESTGQTALPSFAGKRVFVHDSRSAALLADTLAKAEAIQPGFVGDESALGTGAVYDAPRRLVNALGMQQQYSVWSRSLSRSSGADDGLYRTYPSLAAGLAKQRLQEARRVGAELVVADSPLDAAHLACLADAAGIPVYWLPELITRGKP
ncbi:MAG: (Fe-S)-binding protein [Anaerolineae bacterium]|nr:(Fe-S)-binding protein [Anaerolineae bacterium]